MLTSQWFKLKLRILFKKIPYFLSDYMQFFKKFRIKSNDSNLHQNYDFGHITTYIKLQKLPSQQRLSYVISLLSIFFLILNSFQLGQNIKITAFPNAYAVNDSIFLDDNGYLVKSMPANSKRDYSNRESILFYDVQAGDTVSGIAYIFDLKISTVLENNPSLGSGNLLKVGQKITILPIDGLLYTVKKGDSFSSIAKKYSISEEDIKKQNIASTLAIDEGIILPGARLPRPVYIAQTAISSSKAGGGYVNIGTQILNVQPSNSGIINPVPTNGRYSRGSKAHGYQAVDISRSDKSWVPNVVAACDGVIKSVKYGYSGGYGNYMTISCDNGYAVLTAHHSDIYVKSGERVVQGQIVAKMGTTGRSSGLHVHVEIHDGNENKLNPLNFFTLPGL